MPGWNAPLVVPARQRRARRGPGALRRATRRRPAGGVGAPARPRLGARRAAVDPRQRRGHRAVVGQRGRPGVDRADPRAARLRARARLGGARGAAGPRPADAPAPAVAIWAPDDSTASELARLALVVGSCVTVGRLLAGATPLPLLKGAIYLWRSSTPRTSSGTCRRSRTARSPPRRRPTRCRSCTSTTSATRRSTTATSSRRASSAAILAAERFPQGPAALACLGFALLWNQLFLVTGSLPATVPPAAVLLGAELLRRRRWASPRRAASAT